MAMVSQGLLHPDAHLTLRRASSDPCGAPQVNIGVIFARNTSRSLKMMDTLWNGIVEEAWGIDQVSGWKGLRGLNGKRMVLQACQEIIGACVEGRPALRNALPRRPSCVLQSYLNTYLHTMAGERRGPWAPDTPTAHPAVVCLQVVCEDVGITNLLSARDMCAHRHLRQPPHLLRSQEAGQGGPGAAPLHV